MEKENRFLAAAMIMAGYCGNYAYARYSSDSLARMARLGVESLERVMGEIQPKEAVELSK